MPTYNPNIPQPADIMSQSQNDILENFQQINTVFAVNHAAFEAAGEGKHTQVTLPRNAAPTATGATEMNIYSQLSLDTGETELYLQREGAGDIIPLTESGLPLGNDWAYLPSGILLKWGLANSTGLSNPIVFPTNVAIPVFGITPLSILVTPVATNQTIALVVAGTVTNLGFNISTFTPTGVAFATDFYYFAIGA